MAETELGAVQARFADLIWERAPISSGELVKLCEKELNWKKPTTYTVLRKLCEKGIFKNENGTVSAVMTKEEYCAEKSSRFVEETFEGSLPAFFAAFTSKQKLTEKEIKELRELIDNYGKER
ncbi:MAG: BlaI/MecI/CopY family transcriptional regulator [Lachnospiraceae bacterium]|nr:BlaI/MecI/CopY family transcriptional regulator [Lachnospiraceae bacterium]